MTIEDLIWEFENGSISPYKLVAELKEIQLKINLHNKKTRITLTKKKI